MKDETTFRLTIALALAWVAWTVARTWGGTPKDMTALYYAARFFAEGRPDLIYHASPNLLWDTAPETWAELARTLGDPPETLTAYVYPPLWAALLSPLAATTDPQTFYAALMAIFASAYAFGIIAAARAFGRGMPVLHWLALALLLTEVTAIGRLSVGLGQTQMLITGLVLMGFAAYARGNSTHAGVLVGLAAAIKLTPLYFAWLFIADRDWRAFAGFAVTALSLAALSVALTGWPLHAEFKDRLMTMQDTTLLSKITVSLSAALTMLAEGDRSLMTYAWVKIHHEAGALGIAITAFGFGALYWIGTRRPYRDGPWPGLIAMGLLIPLFAPLGWIHYLLLPLALAPGLAATRSGAALLAAVTLAVSIPVYDYLLVQPVILPQLYGTALTLAAFAGALWLAVRASRS